MCKDYCATHKSFRFVRISTLENSDKKPGANGLGLCCVYSRDNQTTDFSGPRHIIQCEV